MISNAIDMRTLEPGAAGPEVHMVNLGVKELFDEFFGGHCWVDVFFSPSVANPGLRAVYENFYGSMARATLAAKPQIPYIGVGTLGNGGIGSPTQLMLDIEIRRSQFPLNAQIKADDQELAFEEIASIVHEGKSFLDSPLTLTRFRDLWRSEALSATTDAAAGGAAITEKSILDRCDQMWRDNIRNNYSYDGLDPDKLRALNVLLERARNKLLG
jgi:trimethylamine:corrinoid methyltransferase-like protein